MTGIKFSTKVKQNEVQITLQIFNAVNVYYSILLLENAGMFTCCCWRR